MLPLAIALSAPAQGAEVSQVVTGAGIGLAATGGALLAVGGLVSRDACADPICTDGALPVLAGGAMVLASAPLLATGPLWSRSRLALDTPWWPAGASVGFAGLSTALFVASRVDRQDAGPPWLAASVASAGVAAGFGVTQAAMNRAQTQGLSMSIAPVVGPSPGVQVAWRW